MKKSLSALKEKFGKFEISKNDSRLLKGGNATVNCDREPNHRDCQGQGFDGGENPNDFAFLCTRQAPSGVLEQEHFGTREVGEAWTHENDHIAGWVSRGCIGS